MILSIYYALRSPTPCSLVNKYVSVYDFKRQNIRLRNEGEKARYDTLISPRYLPQPVKEDFLKCQTTHTGRVT